MSNRHLPVRPDLSQLRRQAKELLQAIQKREPEALAEMESVLPKVDPATLKLADAQFVLARLYGVSSWSRLVLACNLIASIWRRDLTALRAMIEKDPSLIHEDARGTPSNWGPPMSYAANLGWDEAIQMLHDLGAKDHDHAVGRASLQGKIETARLIHRLMGSPRAPDGCLGGPAYTLTAAGTQLMFELGARIFDDEGKSLVPVDVVLETDSRKPAEKHRILQMYADRSVWMPDTAAMELHRGRIDLLEERLNRDPNLLSRPLPFEEVFPPDLRCHDEVLATHGTPLSGASLLHMAIDFDEWEIFLWLLEHGADVNFRAEIDSEGFGGHTPLFATVVSQPNFWMNYQHLEQKAPYTEELLSRGADPNVRASLRKQLHPGYGDHQLQVYRDVTALSWGEHFESKVFVSRPAMELIRSAGGTM